MLIKPKRVPGRPKGLGKVQGSGRKKGTPNKSRVATVELIMKQADPIGFLCKVSRGLKVRAAIEPGAQTKTWFYPTTDQRIHAAETLLQKILPNRKGLSAEWALIESLSDDLGWKREVNRLRKSLPKRNNG